jgi:hypothetical protein
MCADSQETVGIMKFDSPKLVIKPSVGDESDKVRMLFAGAGDGPFIDRLVEEMWKAAQRGQDFSMQGVFDRVEEAVIEWHKKIWDIYKGVGRPEAEILFAIYVPHEVNLYKAIGPIITEIENHAFVGGGIELAEFLADQVRADSDSIEEDVSTSLYILSTTKRYVEGCGGDTQIAALMLDGSIQKMNPWEAEEMAKGIVDISRQIFYLFSASGDLNSKKADIERLARMTASQIKRIHAELRKKISERIEVKPALKESVPRLFVRIEWPPTK